ncbi:hypothetical protein [Jannaschia marina]|uniref:hypothetical protein n=1 Tax=Jannaschia marina TaxID=2741674 RepID=UPI0015C81E22|nr:hypothetical protein [Jannaschia marina]
MTRFAIFAAAALTATSAAAYTGVSPTILAEVESLLEKEGYEQYKIEQFSDDQVTELYLASTSTDTENEKQGRIDAILSEVVDPDAEVILVTPEEAARIQAERDADTSVEEAVQASLDSLGYDVDVTALTDAQVAELYFLTTSESEMEMQKSEIETIINNG